VAVPGIGFCDRSMFAGTGAELEAWWATV